MTFNFDKFIRAAEFSFNLKSVGLVRCKSLSDDILRQARVRIKTPNFESRELVRWLMGELINRPSIENFQESDPIEGDSLTSDQLEAINDQELESFSEQVLQKNRNLVKAHECEELKRVDGQSACDFLTHAIVHRGKEERAQVDRIIQSVSKPLFAESTLDSIRKSVAASNKFEDLIKQYSGDASLANRVLSQVRPEPQVLNMLPVHIPQNPILETNKILENLTGQIEGMRPLVAQGAELIRSMNDTALRLQADYIANAERSDRQTKNAMRVAVLSLVVSAVGLIASSWFSYQSYTDGKATAEEGKSQSKVFEKLTKDLMTAQHEDRVVLTKALADLKQTVPVGKK